MAKIVRYCKLNEEHHGDNCFDVSRPNIFGNPYTHIKSKSTLAQVVVKNRDEAIDLYSEYFERVLKDESDFGKQFREEWEKMYQAYNKYDTLYLGCYCHLDERCHADIIAQKLMQRSMKEKIANVYSQRNINVP